MGKTIDQSSPRTMTWDIVNDTVMGGRSQAQISWNTQNHLVWTGFLSLENNGGFVSIRTRGAWKDWSAYDGVQVALEGAGRDIQVGLRRGDITMRGSSYRALVPTEKKGVTTVFIPFSAFQLKRFGRPIAGPKLTDALTKIGAVGLLMADKRQGKFSITLKSIRPVRATKQFTISPEVGAQLKDAIGKGVPVFNSGDTKGCATIYSEVLRNLHNARKFGQSTWAQRLVGHALHKSKAEDSTTAAWTLRGAMDRVLQSLPETPVSR